MLSSILNAPKLSPRIVGILRAPKDELARAVSELQGIYHCVVFGLEDRNPDRGSSRVFDGRFDFPVDKEVRIHDTRVHRSEVTPYR